MQPLVQTAQHNLRLGHFGPILRLAARPPDCNRDGRLRLGERLSRHVQLLTDCLSLLRVFTCQPRISKQYLGVNRSWFLKKRVSVQH